MVCHSAPHHVGRPRAVWALLRLAVCREAAAARPFLDPFDQRRPPSASAACLHSHEVPPAGTVEWAHEMMIRKVAARMRDPRAAPRCMLWAVVRGAMGCRGSRAWSRLHPRPPFDSHTSQTRGACDRTSLHCEGVASCCREHAASVAAAHGFSAALFAALTTLKAAPLPAAAQSGLLRQSPSRTMRFFEAARSVLER